MLVISGSNHHVVLVSGAIQARGSPTYLLPVFDPALGRLVRVPPLGHPTVVLCQLGLEIVVEAKGCGIVLVRLACRLPRTRPPAKAATEGILSSVRGSSCVLQVRSSSNNFEQCRQ